MNVNDTQAPEPTGDRLEMIFSKQKELAEKYKDVEARRGIGLKAIAGDGPYSLDDHRFQYVMKDYAWRVIEEVAEASSAETEDHAKEEMADAFHFLVELCINSGINYETVRAHVLNHRNPSEGEDTLASLFELNAIAGLFESTFHFVRFLGMTMNCLKNKPWKTTQMETDKRAFEESLLWTLVRFVQLCQSSGMDSSSLYDYYFRKSKVNDFRIRSQY